MESKFWQYQKLILKDESREGSLFHSFLNQTLYSSWKSSLTVFSQGHGLTVCCSKYQPCLKIYSPWLTSGQFCIYVLKFLLKTFLNYSTTEKWTVISKSEIGISCYFGLCLDQRNSFCTLICSELTWVYLTKPCASDDKICLRVEYHIILD